MPRSAQVDRWLTDAGQWAQRALNLLYPRNCPLCRAALDEADRGVVCPACLAAAKLITPPFCLRCALPFAAGEITAPFTCGYCQHLHFWFERAVAACRADGVVRDCIHRLKYQGELYFISHLAAWLIDAARRELDWSAVDFIIPVPLHPRKRRERQFNQAELLARRLSRAMRKPVLGSALRRVKDTDTQTALTAEQRAVNVRGAFAAGRIAGLAGQRVVLVDDVFTTGATLNNCAKVLVQEAGVRSVIALTVARGV